MPAMQPDVAIVHVHEADSDGNARIYGSLFEDILMVTAARRVVLTAEKLVDGATFEAQPELTSIAGFMVDAVVHAPGGAHPCSCHALYDMDLEYLADFNAHTQSPERFEGWLREHVVDAGRVADGTESAQRTLRTLFR